MLQRAASNAYSWWWASHIRTKQSKWLEQNLQDFGEKVQSVLKLIEEDGDSFAKRAEMYYKKRPELIHFVEEAYRAYRSLAERYDHISTELQNANNTIASVFPEQVQFAMEDDEYESASKVPRKGTEASKGNIPQVPKIPKELKGAVTSDTKHLQPKKPTKTTKKTTVVKSGLSKAEGLKKAGRLQKQILALQTEKEFVKSSYESGLAKYWEIEETITEMQDQVCILQDEFGASTVIEDDEARKLMATAALQSCQDTLTRLEEKHEKSAEAARVESERINHAREKLKSLKDNYLHGEVNQENPKSRDESVSAVGKMKSLDQEPSAGTQEKQELEILRAKISEHFDVGSNASFSVSELAEKIDELVNKVISLEASVSSQTALIQRLRTDTDELQAQIGILENDKASLIDEKNDSRDKLRQMEEKLLGLQELNQSVKVQSNNLQSHFTEAHCNLDHLSKKLHDVKPDEELQATRQKELGIPVEDKQQQEVNGQEGSLKTEGEIQKPRKLKSQDGFRGLEGELKLDDIPTEPWNAKSHKETQKPPELKSQEAFRGLESASKLDDIPTESLNAKPHKEIEKPPELKPQEAFRGLESALKLGGIPTEPPNAKPHKELKVSGSFQQENESVAKVSVGELTVKGPNGDDLKVSGGSLKESEGRTSALDPDWKLDEWQEKTNKNFEVSGSSQKGNATTNQKEEEALKERDLSISNRNQMDNVSPLQIDNRLEQSHEVRMEEKYNKQASSKTADGLLPDETKEQETYEPDWKHMFTNGMENREQFLLTEYTTALRNYKDVKKKLGEAEKKKAEDHKNGDGLFDMTLQLKELKNANAKKDEQIKILRQKLSLLQISLGEDNVSENSTLTEFSIMETDITMDQSEMPEIEQKFRSSIDEVLEENLDFWLRFSSTFHQIQKFETETKDLQSELVKLEQKQKRQDANGSGHDLSLKSDAKPLYKHLREIHTELGVWLEKSVLLKDELKSRFSSLCDIQEEITGALKASAEDDDFTFTTYQAAKFQGEILNMKQENNKVADELQAGLDHVTTLQLEVERTLARLNDEFKLSGSRHQQNMQMHRSDSRGTVPLRSFIFGNKPKKQKHSLFSCVHPVLHRKYNGFKGI